MARSDTLLTGSIMTMIAAALVFDDDENGPASPPGGDDPEQAGEGDPDRPPTPR